MENSDMIINNKYIFIEWYEIYVYRSKAIKCLCWFRLSLIAFCTKPFYFNIFIRMFQLIQRDYILLYLF